MKSKIDLERKIEKQKQMNELINEITKDNMEIIELKIIYWYGENK